MCDCEQMSTDIEESDERRRASAEATLRTVEKHLLTSSYDARWIARVKGLRHRIGARHSCKCEECRAIVRVCALATQAMEIKAARYRRGRTDP